MSTELRAKPIMSRYVINTNQTENMVNKKWMKNTNQILYLKFCAIYK